MGEFNAYADAFAAARVYALTSPRPHTTLPHASTLPPYPPQLSKQLTARMFSLDITGRHGIKRGDFRRTVAPLLAKGSPLAEWVSAFMAHSFRTVEAMEPGYEGDASELSLHDPICIWYAITSTNPAWKPSAASPEDIRVDTTGQWTRGMCVVDRRNRNKVEGEEESSGDHGLWLNSKSGNRILRMDGSPVEDNFGEILLQRLFTC